MKILLLKIIPKSLITDIIKILSEIKIPLGLRRIIYSLYVNTYKVNLEEALFPIEEYQNFRSFFTRKIDLEKRPLADANLIVPVDGKCAESGLIENNTLIQAKGFTYLLDDLFNKTDLSKPFVRNSAYWTFYLAPGDYHRIHSPVGGEIVSRLYIPGAFFPVNDFTRKILPNLYIENERIITIIRTFEGREVAVIKVAALNVGSIGLTYEDGLIPRAGYGKRLVNFDKTIKITKGEEIGMFYLGSTVIVLANNIYNYVSTFERNQKVQLGQRLF